MYVSEYLFYLINYLFMNNTFYLNGSNILLGINHKYVLVYEYVSNSVCILYCIFISLKFRNKNRHEKDLRVGFMLNWLNTLNLFYFLNRRSNE